MRFERDRTVHAQHLHQLADEEDDVEIILLLVLGSLEHLGEAAAHRLQLGAGVTDDQRARCGAADDEHLVRDRLEHGAQGTAGDGETAEHHAE